MIHRASRWLVIAALVCVHGALAQEPESFGEKLARQHPVDCMQRLAPAVITFVLQRDFSAWLRGVGDARKLPAGWERGDPHFDAAFDLVYSSALAEEAENGPLATIDMQQRFARAFDRANAAERTQLADFLASPLGPFTWGHIIDDGMCQGLINTMKKTLRGAPHLELLDSVQLGIDRRASADEKKMRTFTPAQRAEIDSNSKLILRLFMQDDPAEKMSSNQFGIDGRAIMKRLDPRLRGLVPKLLEQTDAFAAAAKR